MNRRLIFTFLIVLSIISISKAFIDNDLDGVDDSIDKCPNTPFEQIVGPDGCPIGRQGQERQPKIKGRFYLKIGVGYNTDNSIGSTFSSIAVAYAYKEWYGSISTIYYISDDIANTSGAGNTYIFGSYSLFFSSIYTTFGLNVKVPTGTNNFSDGYFDYTPSLSLDWIRGKDDYFIYYGYTLRGNPRLKNTHSLSIGAGYQISNRFYSSLSIDYISSAITNEPRYLISYFGLFDITRRYYSTLSYSYGLNKLATDHSIFTKIGVRF